MGSRAVALVCRDAATAAAPVRCPDGASGVVHTRTGRPFLDRHSPTAPRSAPPRRRPRQALGRAGRRLAAARRRAAAVVGSRPRTCSATSTPRSARLRGPRCPPPSRARAPRPRGARRRRPARPHHRPRRATPRRSPPPTGATVWPTDGLEGVQLAPFQLLATDGATYDDRDHAWHLGVADRLVAADPGLVRPTRRLARRRRRRRVGRRRHGGGRS